MLDFKIKDWERHFWLKESAKHAEVTWTKFPVSTESISYKRLMAFREGRDAYCVFVAIVQMVARKRLPGVLRQGNTTIEVADISLATGLAPKVVQASIERLALPTIGWLQPVSDLSATVSPPVVDRFQNGGQPVSKRRKTALEVEEEKEEEKDKTKTPARAQELDRVPGAIPMPGDVPEFKPIADAHPKAAGWRKSVDAMREVWASIYEHHGGSGTETERIKRALAWMLETTRAYAKAVEGQETRFLPACDRFWREGIYETPAAWSNSNGSGLRTNGRSDGSGGHAAERRAAKAAREYPEPDIELPVLSFRGDPGADDPEWPPVPAPGGQIGRAGA